MAPTRYADWHIEFNPPPIPFRAMDWQFWHDDFDGAEDACDDRYGYAPSLIEAMTQIDDREDDAWDDKGCADCSQAAPTSCLAVTCKHRDSLKARNAAFALATGKAA